ncbi:hypothetical protein PAHAL_9G487000 [Panicum hallii]|uniref:Uncharacterized protein n=1 Tax=Panicum hallii TaxID=206008 RepID=A0A2T8I543_9POAL|nr:hypothetical protein PAHAL_9G487000 [Panicum hallii]
MQTSLTTANRRLSGSGSGGGWRRAQAKVRAPCPARPWYLTRDDIERRPLPRPRKQSSGPPYLPAAPSPATFGFWLQLGLLRHLLPSPIAFSCLELDASPQSAMLDLTASMHGEVDVADFSRQAHIC